MLGENATSPAYRLQVLRKGSTVRCIARSRMTGNRCRLRPLLGCKRCASHGGRKEQGILRYRHKIQLMPSFYRDALNPTLNALMEQELGKDPQELIQLHEELILVRTLSLQAVQLYSAAQSMPLDHPKRPEYIEKSGAFMMDVLEKVKSFAEAQARIDSMGKGTVTVAGLVAFRDQITLNIYRELGNEHQDIAERLCASLRDRLKIPKSGVPFGTELTPDLDVIEMDATIPKEPGHDPPSQE